MRFVAAAALVLLSCGNEAPVSQEPARKPVVGVVNYPLAYFAGRIGGDMVDVLFPAPADADPAYWQPEDEAVGAYQGADLVLLNGASYARWVDRVSLPPSAVVDTSAAFRDRYIAMEDAVVHSHGPEGRHSHEGAAFTTWLDPTLALLHAEAVRDALLRLLPGQGPAIESNFAALGQDLRSLDEQLAGAFGANGGRPWLASHPVYQYLARRYQLQVSSFHWEPDEMPDEEEWRRFDQVREKDAKRMLWEAPPAGPIAARLEERGISVVVFETCANRPRSGDYMAVMRRNAERVRGD